MKCCYETQRGCSVGGMRRFALSTAFMKHLLCAQYRLGPCHPPSQARMTSSSPGRVHSWAGDRHSHTGVELQCGVYL